MRISSQFKQFLTVVTVAILAVGFTGCKKQSLVSDVRVATYGDGTDVNSQIKFFMDLGNVSLPSIELPIKNHKEPGKVFGTFKLAPTLEGKNLVQIDLNLTTTFNLPGGRANLPNGSDLPIGDIELVDVIEIPFDKYKAEVYLAASNGKILVGFAIVLPALDKLGQSVGNVNFFPSFKIGEVNGLAGVFTSEVEEETGLAAFGVYEAKSDDNSKSLDLASIGFFGDGELKLVKQRPRFGKRIKINRFIRRFKKATKSRRIQLDIATH